MVNLHLNIESISQACQARVNLSIRLYHDVNMAEVVACNQKPSRLASYQYPNELMFQPDEKERPSSPVKSALKQVLSEAVFLGPNLTLLVSFGRGIIGATPPAKASSEVVSLAQSASGVSNESKFMTDMPPLDHLQLNAFGRASLAFSQITDCHLGKQSGERLVGMDTDSSLDHVLKLIKEEQPEAHLLLATGDLANHGSAEAYLRLKAKIAPLGLPYAWLAGNHDSRDLMVDTVGNCLLPRTVRAGRWLIVMMDSCPRSSGANWVSKS